MFKPHRRFRCGYPSPPGVTPSSRKQSAGSKMVLQSLQSKRDVRKNDKTKKLPGFFGVSRLHQAETYSAVPTELVHFTCMYPPVNWRAIFKSSRWDKPRFDLSQTGGTSPALVHLVSQ